MAHPSDPIGIFDSGIGGLTIMQEFMRMLPHERILYFGDTARVPYGNKGPQTIIRYSIENAQFLLEKNIKLLVVACNTASSVAIDSLREAFKIPILGVIEAGAENALSLSRNLRIAVLGTRGTIQSKAYEKAIHKIAPQAAIFPIACPLFVPLVEEEWQHHLSARLIVKEYLSPLQELLVDTVLLGCTHYPLLAPLISQEVGEGIALADSASVCAKQASCLLKERALEAKSLQGCHEFFVSDDPAKFHAQAKRLFGKAFENVLEPVLKL